MMIPLGLLSARFGLALLFAGAAVAKLRHADRWREMLAAYRLLPDALLAPVAVLLPLAELGVALGLVIGFAPAAVAGAALMLAFAIAIAINLQRGRRELDCGCNPAARPQPISWSVVLRNLGLAALLLGCALATAAPLPTDLWLAAAFAGALLYLLLHVLAMLRGFTPAAPRGLVNAPEPR